MIGSMRLENQQIKGVALDKAILDASELEKRQIGKAIHDGLCQELAGIAFLVNSLKRQIGENGNGLQKSVTEITNHFQNALKHAHTLARTLQPVDLIPTGLSGALRYLASDTGDTAGIHAHFHHPKLVEIHDPTTATILYRIAQDCVRNALSYSSLTHIRIALAQKSGNIKLSIADDAPRPPTKPPFKDKMIYEMIRHRARVIGARISIHRLDDRGIRVTCHFPFSEAK